MYQESEIINLVSGIISLLIILVIARTKELPRFRFFSSAFIAILLAYLWTVVEGFLFFRLFNFLEHMSYAAAGVLFAAGCLSLARDTADKDGKDV